MWARLNRGINRLSGRRLLAILLVILTFAMREALMAHEQIA